MATPDSDNTIKLVIPGEPRAQQRHRSAIRPRRGYTGIKVEMPDGSIETLYRKKDLFIHNYDPSYKDKADIIRMLQALAPEQPLDGPLRVDLYMYYLRPDKHYGTGRNAGKLKPSAPIWKTTRPDRDNADKIILDALNKIFWTDDARVCAGEIIKQYSEVPRTEIYITPLDNQKKLFE